MTRTIYIVDDDDAVRASLHGMLSIEDGLNIRSFRSGDRFLEEIESLEWGVLLLDFNMPGSSGLEVLDAVNRLGTRKFGAIILTGEGSVEIAVAAMKAGALDFIEKPYQAEALLAIIDNAFAYLESDKAALAKVESAKNKIDALSPRERDVLKWLIEGHANKHVAFELNISARTVEIYRANLMAKLKVRSLPEAIRIAFSAGMFAK